MVRNSLNNPITINNNSNSSSSNNPKVEKGYEALIKPMQDVIAKDWKVKLCNYLDTYIEHLHEPGIAHINFTEAALLLQNTSNYYCRRVDLMYNWVRQFCHTLAEKFLEYSNDEEQKPDEPAEKEDQPTEPKPKKKPKKNKNQLLSDELDLINLFTTESKSINLKCQKLKCTFGQVLLNASVKTQTKNTMFIPVLQSAVEEMGYKHDFRLHWKIAYDGLLVEDFRYEPTNRVTAINEPFPPGFLNNDNEEDNDAGDLGMDRDEDDGLDILPVPPPNPEFSGSVHLPETDLPNVRASEGSGLLSDNLPDEVVTEVQVAQKKPKKPAENFLTTKPFASLILHRKLKKRQVFKLPQELIDDVYEMRKKRKNPAKPDDENYLEADYNYHLSFSQILGGKSEDMLQRQLSKRTATCMSRRRTRSQKQTQENNDVENATGDSNNDSFEDDNQHFEDLVNDMADELPIPDSDLEKQSESNFDKAYEASTKAFDDMVKSKNDPLSISKRVNAWHQMIQPVLAKAEARSVFSVQEYGTRILDAFDEEGDVRPFSAIVAGQPKEEICRYFLSTLMLANTYNLEIRKTNDDELAKDCLEMKLLTKVRHHDELDANVGATTANGSTF